MRKFLLNIVFFIVAVIAVDLVYGKATDYMITHAKGGSIKKLVDLCKNDKYDILIMGSSKAHHNYIPKIFKDSLNMTCYNAGYDGNGIILAYGILSMIDDSRLPKLIVYDVKQQFDIYQYQGDGDYTRYYKDLKKFFGNPVVDEIIKSISHEDLIKMHSGLYRTNGDLVYMVSGIFHASNTDQNFGYKPAVGMLSDGSEQNKDYKDEIDSLKIEYFKKFVELTKRKRIELVVVFSPEFNTPFERDFLPIRHICAEKGVTILDYFEDPSFQKMKFFKDHCHLNEDGAIVFSNMIIPEIKKNLY